MKKQMYTHYDLKRPLVVRASVELPASKSISNRVLLINALSHSTFMPENLSDCDDTLVMQAALRNNPEVIDIGAAGTAMRFLTAYLSVTPGSHIITGTERMRHRPIGILVDALRQLGAQVEYVGEEGYPPLRITGNSQLEGGDLTLPGNVSSQYISALLMIAPTLAHGLRLTLTDKIVSRPYLNMTISIMREFGASVTWEGDSEILVGPVPYTPKPYRVENDWSAASYWYEIVAATNDPGAWAELPGLRLDSIQGDSCVRYIFDELGVGTEAFTCSNGEEGIRIFKHGQVNCFLNCDFTNCPDLAQAAVVTCILLNVPFNFTGLESLHIKETDRIHALCTELLQIGYYLSEEGKGTLEWNGEREETLQSNPVIDTYDDHRMAMSFAPICCKCHGVRIMNPQVVTKSYPHFWRDLRLCGFRFTNIPSEQQLNEHLGIKWKH